MDKKTTGAPRPTTGEKKHNPDYDRVTSSRMAQVLCSVAYNLLFPHTDNDMESTWGNLNPEQEALRHTWKKVSDTYTTLSQYNAKYQPTFNIGELVAQVTDALAPLMKGGEK